MKKRDKAALSAARSFLFVLLCVRANYGQELYDDDSDWMALSCERNGEDLVVYGNRFALSNVTGGRQSTSEHAAAEREALSHWPAQCKGGKTVKRLMLFATERVTIDRNMMDIADKSVEYMSILAPDWVVEKGNSLSLAGKPGKNEDGDGSGATGVATKGAAGGFGQNGGNFFGIYRKMEGSPKSLSIKVNGGNGGNGQRGGTGQQGERGIDANFYNVNFGESGTWFGVLMGNIRRDYRKPEYLEAGQLYDGCVVQHDGQVHQDDDGKLVPGEGWRFTMTGFAGEKGKRGGDGGDGGLGGNPGSVTLVGVPSETNKSSEIIDISKSKGSNGQVGKGGFGGSVGQRGDNYCIFISRNGFYITKEARSGISTANPLIELYPEAKEMTGPTGEEGKMGTSKAPPTERFPTWKMVNKYKTIFSPAWGTLPQPTSQKYLDFDAYLETNENIFPHLSPLGFANYLSSLENQLFKVGLDHADKFVPLYESLMRTIRNYAKFRANSTSTQAFPDTEKIALNFVYASAIGKLSGMRQQKSIVKVIHTASYFTYLKEELEKMKTKEQEIVIQEQNDQFKDALDRKIKETTGFISNTALPAIEKAEQAQKQESERMQEELEEFLKKAKDNVEAHEKALKKFKKFIWVRYLFGSFKLIGSVVSFLGPAGAAVGGVMGAVGTIGEGLGIGQSSGNETSLDLALPDSIKKPSNSSTTRLYRKMSHMEAELEMVTKVVNDRDNGFSDETGTAVTNVRATLVGVRARMTRTEWTYVEEVSAEQELDKSRADLGESLDKEEEKPGFFAKLKPHAEKIVKGVKAAIDLKKAGMEFYKDVVKYNKDETDRLDGLVKEAKAEVDKIEKRQKEVEDIFIPFLKNMMTSMYSKEQDMKGKSKSGLIVKRWEIQSSLKKMQRVIGEFTKGMDIAEDMKWTLDALEHAMTLLCNLYDNIEAYEEKKQLADYMANIVSAPDAIKAAITDPNLKWLMPKVQLSIKMNLFLGEYRTAMNSFKQWVFPFEEDYLKADKQVADMSDLLDPTLDIPKSVEIYKNKIDRLESLLKLYPSLVMSRDSSVMQSNFSSDFVSSSPFFTWTNSDWQSSIRRLFSGGAITLAADLNEAEPSRYGKAAVKFRRIELGFRLDNESLRQELMETLNHFEVIMKHSGVSNYLSKGVTHTMYDNQIELRYNFESGVSENMVKIKMQEHGDFLLSPYTVWTFKLVKPGTSKDVDFAVLSKFVEHVDLELTGSGLFVDERDIVLKTRRENITSKIDNFRPPTLPVVLVSS